jgi:polyisoprenoid-binding protein YceI
MSSQSTQPTEIRSAAATRWRIDPQRSTVEFRVPHFYGLLNVKGRFERHQGTLGLSGSPAVELAIDADSVQTKQKARDTHLRSPAFFNTESRPHVRPNRTPRTSRADGCTWRGTRRRPGHVVPLGLEAVVQPVGDELEIVAETTVDKGDLGMT